MAQQKALVLTSKGGPFETTTLPIPKPAKGEALIKIHSVGLNPIEWKVQAFKFLIEDFPAVLGTDAAGVVEEVGEGVTSVSKGDKVLWQGLMSDNRRGTFQQYAVAPSNILAKFNTSTLSFDQAATTPTSFMTAAAGLYNAPLSLTPPWTPSGKGKYKSQPIVVLGGASSVGQGAIQWAKLSGFEPIITTASSSNSDYLKSLGATHVVDRSAGDVAAQIKKLAGGTAVSIVYDAVSVEATQKLAVQISKEDASIVLTLPAAGSLEKGARNVFQIFGNAAMHPEFGPLVFEKLGPLLDSGALKPNQVEVIPGGLGGIPAGLTKLREGKNSGVKLIVHATE